MRTLIQRKFLAMGLLMGLAAPQGGIAATVIQMLDWDATGSRCSNDETTHSKQTDWASWISGVDEVSRWKRDRNQAVARIQSQFDAQRAKLLEEHRALSNRQGGSAAQDIGDSSGDFAAQVYANSLAQARLTMELNAALRSWDENHSPMATQKKDVAILRE